jgi:hypothetical protein
MKFKLLLLLLFVSLSFLKAQQPYKNLIFSEVRIDEAHNAYVEICNMGDVAVDLSQFEVGNISPWGDPFVPGADSYVRLPAKMLNPGKTFVIARVLDWAREMALVNPERYGPVTKADTWRLADMQIHDSESPNNDPTDSISLGFSTLVIWNGSYCMYLRHHFINEDSLPDSMVIDAVNGVFTSSSGHRPDGYGPSDVAGVSRATGNSILVRKFSVKTGTGDALDSWDKSRGLDLDDSEWLPVPRLTVGGYEAGRKEFWTVGNHGDYHLNAQTLVSSTISIDWNSKNMTAAWGVRNMDSIMNEFQFAPGIAWHYQVSKSKIDSTFTSVRTGDSITLYACGNQLEMMKFGITALPPTASECRVIPKNARNGNGWITPFIVTEDVPGMDSIMQVAYDTRVDTLLKYLEKPEKASWKIIWVDGVERPDLKKGDKLKVTAENGTSVKEYYINILKYRPGHNATLSSITWPDIPENYKGFYGWKGDTIPDFSPTKFNYKVQIPWDVQGIPAFVVKTQDPDAKIVITRAATLAGTLDDRTIKYTITAEDDTSINTYSIQLEKEKDLTNVQPFSTEPFFSQFVFRADWSQNFIEICNPGNQDLDLNRYVLVRSYSESPAEAISIYSAETDWANRYNRYVPGFVWQDEASWQVQPGILEQDLSVNSIVKGGDVFVIAWAYPNYENDASTQNRLWENFGEIDVNFKTGYNPWGIEFTEDKLGEYVNVAGGWYNSSWLLYKILNDSVLNGLKPLRDPEDVQIIDIIGRCNGTNFGTIDGQTYDQNSGLKRLKQYHKGNTEPGGSFGDGTVGTSEWLYTTSAYWTAKGYGWPDNNFMTSDGIGSHEFTPISSFISTVSSVSFVVSSGYSMNESIIGPAPGITVDGFLEKIIKSDDAQKLTLTRGSTVLTGSDALVTGDALTVVSADGQNTTKYIIDVSVGKLATDAKLTSTIYTINVSGNSGTVSGFAPGTLLRTVYEGVTVPATASLFTIYNSDGTYASFKEINFDTVYVDVIATDQIFFEVTAQDGTTKITYQLQPTSNSSDAYVLSNVYDIDQDAAIIKLLPDGTNVTSFFGNLIPAPGATIKLLNKMDQVRDFGTIYKDDKLVVTAQNGINKKVYTLKMYSETALAREARVFSDIYLVSQTKYTIKIPKGTTEITEFISKITISQGATYELFDSKGNVKTTGAIAALDKIKVTSADGKRVSVYTISFKVSSAIFKQGNIRMYPNPTTGEIKIAGIQPGNTVQIFNAVGHKVLTFVASKSFETASIFDQPAGMYFIIVDDGNQAISRFKLIKN